MMFAYDFRDAAPFGKRPEPLRVALEALAS
jgi:hypothetical protein